MNTTAARIAHEFHHRTTIGPRRNLSRVVTTCGTLVTPSKAVVYGSEPIRPGHVKCEDCIRVKAARIAEEQARRTKLATLRAIVAANRAAGRFDYEGLESHEIGTLSGAMIFGDDGEAFPGDAEWSAWVD